MPKQAVSNENIRINGVIFSMRLIICTLYVEAKIMIYKDMKVPMIPQTKITVDSVVSN